MLLLNIVTWQLFGEACMCSSKIHLPRTSIFLLPMFSNLAPFPHPHLGNRKTHNSPHVKETPVFSKCTYSPLLPHCWALGSELPLWTGCENLGMSDKVETTCHLWSFPVSKVPLFQPWFSQVLPLAVATAQFGCPTTLPCSWGPPPLLEGIPVSRL